jgi:DNA-damage-inducible protein J
MYLSRMKRIAMTTTPANAMIHVRIDEKTKARAAETLARRGLSVSEAVRLFLRRVVADQQMSFEIKVPNATTRRAIAEINEMSRTRKARFATADELFASLEKNSRR